MRGLFPEAGPLSMGAAKFAKPLDRVAAGNIMTRKKRFDEILLH